MTVFELTQPYITDCNDKEAIKGITIQRISKKEWLPLFHIVETGGIEAICAIKTMTNGSIRRWNHLETLCDWIRNDLGIYTLSISLTDVELIFQGDKSDD